MPVHPKKDSQVRQLVWVGDGVWCSIRLDSTIRLYHAHNYQHLQDIDIEPYVTKMLGTSKLGFSFVRITALMVSSQRLWVGTGNGVVISVPLHEESDGAKQAIAAAAAGGTAEGVKGPGGAVRVYADPAGGEGVSVGSNFLPYCSMNNAQLSFHGHKDAVKFFVAVPGVTPPAPTPAGGDKKSPDKAGKGSPGKAPEAEIGDKRRMLILSGGDGYIDFRMGEEEEEDLSPSKISKRSRSHLIVWEILSEKEKS